MTMLMQHLSRTWDGCSNDQAHIFETSEFDGKIIIAGWLVLCLLSSAELPDIQFSRERDIPIPNTSVPCKDRSMSLSQAPQG